MAGRPIAPISSATRTVPTGRRRVALPYSLAILWRSKQTFLSAVLAVAFSSLLINLQCGLLLGIFSLTSIPVDHSRADLWMGSPRLLSVDLGEPMRESTLGRLALQPEVVRVEPYVLDYSRWYKPGGGRELCVVVGCHLGPGSLGVVDRLTPSDRRLLEEPGAVFVDSSDLERLGIEGVGARAEVGKHAVRVVGLTQGLESLTGPYVFCSLRTARILLTRGPATPRDQITYALAECRSPDDAPRVVARLRQEYPDVSTFTRDEISLRSQLHWLLRTKGGLAMGYAAVLGLIIGCVITSQTLHSATLASLRELAVLRAMGIPRRRIAGLVLAQSFQVGLAGVLVGFLAFHGTRYVAIWMGVSVVLPWLLQAGAAAITLLMALFSGLFSLRSLRLVDPAVLLR
jgi:putative ABC transport system permease protein